MVSYDELMELMNDVPTITVERLEAKRHTIVLNDYYLQLLGKAVKYGIKNINNHTASDYDFLNATIDRYDNPQ